ncbi:MAG: hypothetical protein ACP5D2_02055 [Candidatus Nanoarchaeia archaeon]
MDLRADIRYTQESVNRLMETYGLDDVGACDVLELMDRGMDEDEAVSRYDFLVNNSDILDRESDSDGLDVSVRYHLPDGEDRLSITNNPNAHLRLEDGEIESEEWLFHNGFGSA